MRSIAQSKQALRPHAIAARKRARAEIGDITPESVIRHILNAISSLPHIVSAYVPLPGEIDPLPALMAIEAQGHQGCLPVVLAKETPLLFRAWSAGEALEPGPFRTRHPGFEAEEVSPDVLLVPLLAFDRRGYRLGWGGGFYDRTLQKARADGRAITAIGLAYSAQEVDAVPHDDYDQRLDWVVTETDLIKIETE